MTNEALKRKEDFLRRKKGVRNEADMVAQQLVNIYRQLSILGDDATQKYNQQLIRQANPEVLSSLRTIPGGEEVREYYAFLTHTETNEGNTDAPFAKGNDSLLPKPEEMSPIWESFGMNNVGTGINRQNPIPMAVVNPIRASVVTTSASGSTKNAEAPITSLNQQSSVDFDALENEVLDAYDKQKQSILQALKFIVIDSDIEKMHQNLKNAIHKVEEDLDTLKDNLVTSIDQANENSVFPPIMPEKQSLHNARLTAGIRVSEKFRRNKNGQKFLLDTTDDEE